MSITLQIIQASDLDEIVQFEQKISEKLVPDEMERTMQSWHARWRKESLDHYLPMGWSFLARSDSTKELVGYFIAQPLLFFDGFTQTLWVEHMQFINESVRDQLCEVAYKLSREKHFQKVLFPKEITPHAQALSQYINNFKSENWQPQVLSAWTAKVSPPR